MSVVGDNEAINASTYWAIKFTFKNASVITGRDIVLWHDGEEPLTLVYWPSRKIFTDEKEMRTALREVRMVKRRERTKTLFQLLPRVTVVRVRRKEIAR